MVGKAKNVEEEIKPEALWHSLSVEESVEKLSSSLHGLSQTEAIRRLRTLGSNSLPVKPPTSTFVIFLRQFQSPLIYILLLASVVVFFLGGIKDSIAILAVLFINAFVGLYQEGKAENTLAALKRFTKTDAAVLRDDVEIVVDDKEVVPGDIIALREGDKVPADARILDEKSFRVDESALTGESKPVAKVTEKLGPREIPTADKKNMVFKGTLVLSGNARAIVVNTGISTVIGILSKKMATIDTAMPLKDNIKALSRFIGIGVFVASVIVFVVGVLYGNSVRDMFFTAVTVAVSLIPEGLPIVITLVLATGVYRMAKQNALVKKLGAVEALGQASVIAVDKTGTITKNELMIEEVFVGSKHFKVLGNGYEPKGSVLFLEKEIDTANHPELLFAGKLAAFCASARVSIKENEAVARVIGDPTEAALRVFGEKIGFPKDDIEREEPQIAEIPFDSKIKYHATLHAVGKKKFLTIVGAPEAVLPLCESIMEEGKNRKLSEERRKEIEAAIHEMSRKSLRVLLCAVVENYKDSFGVDPIKGLTFVCIYGMRDVLRQGVRESVEEARALGLRVIMITGDHRNTAESIAREAGIFRDGDHVLSDTDFINMKEEELLSHLGNTTVFARITPEHKFTIIELSRKRGDIIAMTGDGVNDALSLAAADLGIAMGKSGTEVSKEAADIVLLDDNFKSIVLAIEEGRNMYRGIKKVVAYLFGTGLGELFTILGAMLLFLPIPFVPTQILWLNLITDGFLVVALAMEAGEKSSKTKGGNKPSKRIFFDRGMVVRTFIMGTVMAVGSVLLFHQFQSIDPLRAGTIALTALAMFQWWNAWNVRSEGSSIFSRNLPVNKYLVGATVLVIILQLFAIYNPIMQKILVTVPLTFSELLIALAVSLSIVLVEEVRKLFYRRTA